MFKSQQIQYLLVRAPITKSFYESYTNNQYYDSLMQSYGRYIDFNKRMHLTDTLHFYDGHHLNQAGVNIFNESLMQYLKKHRSDN